MSPTPTPTLTVLPATPDDIPTFTSIYLSAFTDTLAHTAFPRSSSHIRPWWTAINTDDMANQISARFLKVVEGDIDGADENGVVDVAVKDAQIIAYAKWNVPVLVDGKLSGGGDDADDMPVWPEGADAELCNDVFPYFARERKKNMGERPHYYLEIVATLPEHQGKGAAGKLIRWGLERADREGLEAYLEASPAAVPIYEHYGFKTVSSYSPKRIEHTESFMLRAPRPTEE